MLPLDITTPHELPFPYYTTEVDPTFGSPNAGDAITSHLVKFTSAFFERTREVMLQFGKDAMELHDIAAVWCAIEHPPVELLGGAKRGWSFARRKFEIER